MSTLEKQRKIQSEVDRAEEKRGEKRKSGGPVQTGSRDYPAVPLPPAQREEVAPAYVFLASPVTGSYITGLVLPVFGGIVGAMASQPQ